MKKILQLAVLAAFGASLGACAIDLSTNKKADCQEPCCKEKAAAEKKCCAEHPDGKCPTGAHDGHGAK